MSERSRTGLLGLVLAVLALVAHRGHAVEFLNYDDDDYVTENPIVKYGLSADSARRAFTEPQAANWHPLTWLSHMVDVELFDLDPAAHQRTSRWIHALSALLLFLFLARTTRAPAPSFLAAGLFALHPQHVESVHWISERKDVLSGLFWMATLLAHAHYARRPSWARYLLVASTLLLGLLAKATGVTLPFVLLLMDLWPLGRLRATDGRSGEPLRRLVLEKLPLLLLAAAIAATAIATQSAYGTPASFERLPLDARVSNAATAAATYLGKALWPTNLAAFYPHPAALDPGFEPWNARALLALLAIAAALAAAWRSRRRRPWITVGVCWFLGTLVPLSGLVQVGVQSRADRYAYLPLIGFYAAVCWTAWEALPRARRALIVLGLAALGALSFVTARQSRVWRDSRTLFEHALEVTEDNYVALIQLADLELVSGRPRSAEALLLRSGEIHTDSQLCSNLSAVQIALEKWGVAEQNARRALELDGGNPEAHVNLGVVLGSTERFEKAAASFQRATELRPSYADAWYDLGLLHLERGRRQQAAECFRRVLRIDPGWAEVRALLDGTE